MSKLPFLIILITEYVFAGAVIGFYLGMSFIYAMLLLAAVVVIVFASYAVYAMRKNAPSPPKISRKQFMQSGVLSVYGMSATVLYILSVVIKTAI